MPPSKPPEGSGMQSYVSIVAVLGLGLFAGSDVRGIAAPALRPLEPLMQRLWRHLADYQPAPRRKSAWLTQQRGRPIVYLTEQHWLLRQSIGPTSNTARRMFAFKVILIRQKQMLRVVHLDLDQGTSALRHKTKPMLAWGPCPVSPAGSTDRRNTFCVLLSWGLKEQGLSRPFIEPPGDRAELGLAIQ